MIYFISILSINIDNILQNHNNFKIYFKKISNLDEIRCYKHE